MSIGKTCRVGLLYVAALAFVTFTTLHVAAADKATKSDPYMEDYARRQTNIETVVAFYKGLANFDFEACQPYLGDHYTQHNPTVQDGVEGLKKALRLARRMLGPKGHNVVDQKLIVADGDYVILLSHQAIVKEDVVGDELPRGNAVADIFRLENGKIVEHWDTIEEMPEKLKNSGMF